MAITADKKKLLYKIAKAYYEDGLTQGQIGKRFGLSRIKVSRLLQQARDERIVQIMITPPQDSNAELERKLEARYGLNEVVVISPSNYDKAVIVQELGPAAVDCLLRCLQGAVGDIALRFFDAEGQPVEHQINDRIIGLDLDQIKGIPRVIGVAGGAEKFEVIRAALRGEFIDVLITDDRIAARLLEDEKSSSPELIAAAA
jgi:DNA-binding transcriptional regulator LsrR (DeoR family)